MFFLKGKLSVSILIYALVILRLLITILIFNFILNKNFHILQTFNSILTYLESISSGLLLCLLYTILLKILLRDYFVQFASIRAHNMVCCSRGDVHPCWSPQAEARGGPSEHWTSSCGGMGGGRQAGAVGDQAVRWQVDMTPSAAKLCVSRMPPFVRANTVVTRSRTGSLAPAAAPQPSPASTTAVKAEPTRIASAEEIKQQMEQNLRMQRAAHHQRRSLDPTGKPNILKMVSTNQGECLC